MLPKLREIPKEIITHKKEEGSKYLQQFKNLDDKIIFNTLTK